MTVRILLRLRIIYLDVEIFTVFKVAMNIRQLSDLSHFFDFFKLEVFLLQFYSRLWVTKYKRYEIFITNIYRKCDS